MPRVIESLKGVEVGYSFEDKSKNIKEKYLELLRITSSMFKYNNLPESIRPNILEMFTQIKPVIITKHNDELIVLQGEFSGVPVNDWIPNKFIVANPYYNIFRTYTLGEDAVLYHNDSLYLGLGNIINKYATFLVENELTLYMNSILSRAQFIFTSTTDATSKSADAFIDYLKDGKLKTIVDKSFEEGMKVNGTQSSANNTLTNLIELQQYLKASYFNEIGLNSNYNMKRESINASEAQMNEDALLPLIDDMLETRKKCLEEVNKLFGTNISVEFSNAWQEEIVDEMTIEEPQETEDPEETEDDGTKEI